MLLGVDSRVVFFVCFVCLNRRLALKSPLTHRLFFFFFFSPQVVGDDHPLTWILPILPRWKDRDEVHFFLFLIIYCVVAARCVYLSHLLFCSSLFLFLFLFLFARKQQPQQLLQHSCLVFVHQEVN